jgi:hypothetical protein
VDVVPSFSSGGVEKESLEFVVDVVVVHVYGVPNVSTKTTSSKGRRGVSVEED